VVYELVYHTFVVPTLKYPRLNSWHVAPCQLLNIRSVDKNHKLMKSLLLFKTSKIVQFTTIHKIAYITFSPEFHSYP